MWHVLLDALIDSLKVLGIIFLIYILIELAEDALSKKLKKNSSLNPLFGASLGLIPQCGFSIVASDLYSKKQISMGTILAIFIATSDEAFPIILSTPSKIFSILPMIGIKLVVAIGVGYLVDLCYRKQNLQIAEKTEKIDHKGCCGHHIEKKESNFKKYFVHPLIHSLKIFAYVFVANVIFGIIIYYVGEEKISTFLLSGKYYAPAIAVLIGLIPNCAGSVILSELFCLGNLGFGACVGGLICNAGLGLLFLFKQNKNIKQNLSIFTILISTALTVGYCTSLILNFK